MAKTLAEALAEKFDEMGGRSRDVPSCVQEALLFMAAWAAPPADTAAASVIDPPISQTPPAPPVDPGAAPPAPVGEKH